MENQTPNLPAVIDQTEAQETAKLLALLDPLKRPGLYLHTNLDLKDPLVQDAVLLSMGTAKFDLATIGNQRFPVMGYYAHVVRVPKGNDGEVVPTVRVVLLDPDGNALEWYSEITTRYWTYILSMKGAGPWHPPLEIEVVPHKGKDTGYWYSLSTRGAARPMQEPAKPKR